ncbi:MAG: AMP-binding protein, partial [Oscillospiraceae bacterium]|nr:AMP-binding protein [Oscillospiraceae bacterium]
QRNLAYFVRHYRAFFRLDESCRVAAYASYGFDACMMDLFAPLTAGACVCIVEEEIRLDLVAIEAMFNRLGVTHSFMTTQVARQFYTLATVPSLRYLVTGGEKLVPVAPRTDADTVLYNAYGPTECTVIATYKLVDRLYDRVPIGRPTSNCKCYVVDGNLNRLPPFVPGELLIAGRGVGRGYLNRPDLTEKTFVPNPFSDDPAYARAYRTGDVVRLLPDGEIDFVGRSDGQVKVRGFRIELTEVESVVREFPGVADATVQAFEDENTGEKFIAAYVVSGREVDVSALNDFIRQRKPAYMVPAVTMQLDRIPLNQNGKVNKRALPKPEPKARGDAGSAGGDAPLNELEQELKEMVSGIVNTTEFGVNDRFGDLGLSSISGIRLAMQVYKRFNVQLDSRKLISEGCIRSVEDEIRAGIPKAEAAPEEKRSGAQSCRLGFAQQGVYAEYQANPDAVHYNLPFAARFPEGIGARQLEDAVRRVVEAHPYILCRFVPNDENEIVQEPIPDFILDIPYTELSAEAFEDYKKAFVRPFDLAKGPPVRFEIVKTDGLVLLADMHHLVSDGASVDLFFSQLCRALDGEEPEKETYSYYDYVSEQRIDPETEAFFEGRMAKAEEATRLIPDVFDDTLPHTEKFASVPTDIAGVKDFARRSGVTPAAVYLAASCLAFGRYVCEDTVAIATVSNGRGNLKTG